ncbi:5'-methylthioadenosine/adenosylhomocysteine nucleosidase [Carnobacteriaceae bacterium zg-ZUI252]|nr:5'-methylthioadenosine/adenosylhomocysteine nucleosidase [Carnobacteriaceae bacterium zg-ZUI252]
MKIGIIGAMAQETKLLLEQMVDVTTEVKHHLTFYSGTLQNKEVVLVQSGIGKVASAIATTLLVTHFSVDYVINTGSAGSLNPNLHIGNVVISNQVAYHDVEATAFGYQYGQVPQMPLYYVADERLINAATKALNTIQSTRFVGEIVSSDSFIAEKSKIENIKEHFPNALCTEMEGASIAQTCHILNVPFIVIRAISDNANEEAHMTFDEFIILAGETSAKMVMNMLTHL